MSDQAMAEFYNLHRAHVLAYCVRRIGFSDSDDVAAEVFEVAWRKFDQIDPETARLWLYAVARRVIGNGLRSRRRRSKLADRAAGLRHPSVAPPDEVVVQRAEDAQVIAILRSMRRTDQEVLMLSAWEELSCPDIGRVMTISTSAAEQRLHRARRRLETALATVDRSSNGDSKRRVER